MHFRFPIIDICLEDTLFFIFFLTNENLSWTSQVLVCDLVIFSDDFHSCLTSSRTLLHLPKGGLFVLILFCKKCRLFLNF
jgi:hypothetical protein